VALVTSECVVKVRARSVIIAQGAYEQPAVFRGNDLPGVMLASAAQRLLYHQAVASARRVAVLTANAHGYAAALDALGNGIEVAAVLDLRAEAGALSAAPAQELTRRGVALASREAVARVMARWWPALRAGGGIARRRTTMALDGIWMSVGFMPTNALYQLVHGSATCRHSGFPAPLIPPGYACGKVNGVYGFDERLADGRAAGDEAPAARLRQRAGATCRSRRSRRTIPIPSSLIAAGNSSTDEDLTVKDRRRLSRATTAVTAEALLRSAWGRAGGLT
jgi:sarcosine oxidase subunit alpha